MKVTIVLGEYRLLVVAARYQKATGVASELGNGRHFLMWDFDNVERDDVDDALKGVQVSFNLPNIYVMQTGPVSWHAYCFQAMPWPRVICVLASTARLDPSFLKMTVIRGYSTLRFTEKKGRKFLGAHVLNGNGMGDVNIRQAANVFVRYQTAKK